MTAKSRGTAFEYRVRDHLITKGWEVFRSAGSHTYADLIALKAGPTVLLVQCKAMDRPSISYHEKNALQSAARRLGAQVLVIGREGIPPYALNYWDVRPGRLEEIIPLWVL